MVGVAVISSGLEDLANGGGWATGEALAGITAGVPVSELQPATIAIMAMSTASVYDDDTEGGVIMGFPFADSARVIRRDQFGQLDDRIAH